MIEKAVAIPTADGMCDGFLYQPEAQGRWPGVVFLTDIFGIRPASQGMAKRLAAEGYAVLLPNIFYRVAKPPVFDFQPSFGEERTMKRLGELRAAVPIDAQERDNTAYLDFLSKQESARAPIGVVGYCLTGSMAMRMAAAHPDKIAAVASFHGGGLFTEAPDSPHMLLPRIKGQMYFGHATDDRSMPAEAIAKFEKALGASAGKFQSETYDAPHGWSVPGSPMYREPEAEKAFQKLTELLRAALK